jgi:hypothetical protein
MGTRTQQLRRAASDAIVVAGDVEPPQPGRWDEPCQVRRRQSRDDRQCRQDDAERQHRLQALAGCQYPGLRRGRLRVAETDAVPEETAHRPPRRCRRRLADATDPGVTTKTTASADRISWRRRLRHDSPGVISLLSM